MPLTDMGNYERAKSGYANMHISWRQALGEAWCSPAGMDLHQALAQADLDASSGVGPDVFPPRPLRLRAFGLPVNDVRVVIVGQDPYHTPGVADGLAFSSGKRGKIPASLRNILKEIRDSTGSDSVCADGSLAPWEKQGVLLLNTALTVFSGSAGSMGSWGWQDITSAAISHLSETRAGVVFMLWGQAAQAKADLIDPSRHFVLTAAHPSPFSARKGFFGCDHFVLTNEIFRQLGQPPIRW